jgi:hypothetical protein
MTGVNGARVSAYDRALELCKTPEAKLTIARLGAELGLPASASEWVILTLYAEAHGLFGAAESDRQDLAARLDRIEKLVQQRIPHADPVSQITRYAAVFVTGFIVAEGAAAMLLAGWVPPAFDRLFAFGCGLTLTALVLVYLWLAPIVTGRGRLG